MPFNTSQDPELYYLAQKVRDVRTVCLGSAFVKQMDLHFLPNPVDKTDNRSDQYQAYLRGALLDDWANLTQKTMLGKMKLSDVEIDIPEMPFINNNIDGDGMSLGGALNNAARSILEAKYEIWLTDFRGFASLDPDNASKDDVEKLNQQPVLRRYSRERLVHEPYFRMINGKNQLAFIMLDESTEIFNPKTAFKQKTDSYLILALDDDGNYFQQRVINGRESDPIYPLLNGQNIKSIPLQFVSDEEVATEIPLELGYLSGIVDIVLTKYQNSAHKSRFLANLPPTKVLYTGSDAGLTEDWQKAFNLLNAGNENTQADLNMGGNIIIPGEDAKLDIISSEGNMQPYFDEDESLENRARQLGAVVSPNEAVTKTATESLIDEATRNAVMLPLVSGLEDAVKWHVAYSAMFHLGIPQDSLADYQSNVEFMIDRAFAVQKVSIDEARFMFELFGFPSLTGGSENPTQESIDLFVKWLEKNGYGNLTLLLDS